MSLTKEQAAVLALTRATAGPWHHTARVVEARGSALRLVDGDFTGLDQEDRAHAARVTARLRPGDLDRAERLITACRDRLVTVLDDDYPGNLAYAHDLQPFLWVRGRLRESDCRSVAIVTGDGGGDRDDNDRARGDDGDDGDDGPVVARALAEAGLTVVCDAGAPAADAALTAGGRAITVLPGGLPALLGGAPVGGAGEVVVSAFWPDAAVTPATVALAQGVTSGLAAAVYVSRPGGGGRAAVALSQGKHVFAPPGLPWTSRVGYRGGVTVVAGIDDLVRQAVNLVDVTRLTTVF
ncbi:MAG: hypothetical protein HOV96_17005 [Nonomuraea sp.]|nr:hypothetical protein [Nonomuraea sp.]